MRVRICRKEAKETRYWLNLLDLDYDEAMEQERKNLVIEATELMHISGAIITKVARHE